MAATDRAAINTAATDGAATDKAGAATERRGRGDELAGTDRFLRDIGHTGDAGSIVEPG
jgi:hypothetical protein